MMSTCLTRYNAFKSSGFSLIELAVVLMIIGTLMSGVLVAVSQTTANARITNSKAQLREVEEALYGFAQAYGRLPCPATDASATPGAEDALNCPEHGFVPSGTLGIDGPVNADGLLVDPWQNPIRYSVITEDTPGNPNFSDRASIQDFFNDSRVIDPTGMFVVCKDSACAEIVSDVAPAVLLSLGPNGTSFTSADEAMNAGAQVMSDYSIKDDTSFVSAPFSEDNFDDQLIWLSPYILFNRLVSAGKLP